MLVPLAANVRVGLGGGDEVVCWLLFLLLLPLPSTVSSEGNETDWISASSVCEGKRL